MNEQWTPPQLNLTFYLRVKTKGERCRCRITYLARRVAPTFKEHVLRFKLPACRRALQGGGNSVAANRDRPITWVSLDLALPWQEIASWISFSEPWRLFSGLRRVRWRWLAFDSLLCRLFRPGPTSAFHFSCGAWRSSRFCSLPFRIWPSVFSLLSHGACWKSRPAFDSAGLANTIRRQIQELP